MAAIDFPSPVEGLKHLSWIYTNGAWVKQPFDVTFILASSGNWESTYTTVDTESANWNSTYNTVTSLSNTWDDQFDSTELEAASGNWNSTYTTVTNESADWGIDTIYDDSLLQASSADWDSTYTTVSSNSASWSGAGTGDFCGQVVNMSELSSCGTGSISVSAEFVMNDNPISKLHYIDWDLDHTLVPEKGRLSWNVQDQTLDLGLNDNVNLQIGQESVVLCKAAEPILKGQAVYISGSEGNSENFLVSVASNDTELTSHNTLGIAAEDFGDAGQETHGYITTFGRITGIDTLNLDAGELIYLGLNGALTKDRPLSPDHEIILGYCIRTQQNNGVIYVSVDLGVHLEELHDASLTNIQNNDVLLYNSTSALWENVTSNNWESTYTTMSANSANWVKYDIEDIATPATWVLDVDTLTDTALPDGSPIKVPTQQSVKAYVDGIVTGINNLKGGYEADTDIPAISAGVGVLQGDTYYITASGTFYTQQVDKGDLIIATIDNADADGEWIVVNRNIDEELFDKWDSTSTTVSANSADWDSTYTTVSSNSAIWQTSASTSMIWLSAQEPNSTDPGCIAIDIQRTIDLGFNTFGNSGVTGTTRDPRGLDALDLQIAATDKTHVAGGRFTTLLGGTNNKINKPAGTNFNFNEGAVIVGGRDNEVLNGGSFGVILGGKGNLLTNQLPGSSNFSRYSVILGGENNTSKFDYTCIFSSESTLFETKHVGTFNIEARGDSVMQSGKIGGLRYVHDGVNHTGDVLTCVSADGYSSWRSLSADEWNSTYTTVSANSGIWDNSAALAFNDGKLNSIEIGILDGTTETGEHSITIQGSRTGHVNVASGVDAIAIGTQTKADSDNSVALGTSAAATGNGATALGWNTIASADNSTAVGPYSKAGGGYGSCGFGHSVQAIGAGSLAYGYNCQAKQSKSAVFGRNVINNTANTAEIGWWADTGNTGRRGSVRMDSQRNVSFSIKTTAVAMTDGGKDGKPDGSEPANTLGRQMIAFRRNGNDFYLDANDPSGIITTLPLGNSLNNVITVTSNAYTQTTDTTHTIYNDDDAGVTTDIVATLMAPADHTGTTVHKKVGSSHNVVITPPSGLIDGAASFTLQFENESISIFSDGTNFYIT